MPANTSIAAAIAKVVPGEKSFAVVYNGKTLGAGEHVPKAQTHAGPPELIFPIQQQQSSSGASAPKTYLVVMLDLDAPYASFPILGPLLHWIQPGVRATTSGSLTYTQSDPFLVDYIGASPPPGSGPHRYAFFVYEQPDGFELKRLSTRYGSAGGQKVGAAKRVRFDLDAFEREAGLGRSLGCTYVKSN
ncbi:Hypothetical predicted protein [Lecanosticta acicola]|uniref:PEBP-like protein n=1 Tax=Lecanosticta acicola TaxID=111012 RepID=A0AAI8YWY8_9PEZI|nr:Hypothetical predicted protein [Lecanosticta acicola]